MVKLTEYLFEKHYLNHSYSESVTSSHWRKSGEKNAKIIDGIGKLQGKGGFGDYKPITIAEKIKNIPTTIIIKFLSIFFKVDCIYFEKSKKLANQLKVTFGSDAFKAALILTDIKNNFNNINNFKKICIIGDGYGFLGCLIKEVLPESQIVFINLGQQLFWDATSVEQSFPNLTKTILDSANFSSNSDFIFIEAENYNLLCNLEIDLFINIVSFQEMNLAVIKNYFKFMKQSKSNKKYLYCLNREEKILPDGEKIKLSEYPWELCKINSSITPKWCQGYFINKPPFYKKYDGVHLRKIAEFI